MKTASAVLSLVPGETLVIHAVPENNAIKVTAKFIRPDSPEQGATRIVSISKARQSPDQLIGSAIAESLAELRKAEPRSLQ
jgi:hypothetical protein